MTMLTRGRSFTTMKAAMDANAVAGAIDPSAPRIIEMRLPFTLEDSDRVPSDVISRALTSAFEEYGAPLPVDFPVQAGERASAPPQTPPSDFDLAEDISAISDATVNLPTLAPANNKDVVIQTANVYDWRFVGAEPLRDKSVVDVKGMRINSDRLPLLWMHDYYTVIGRVYDFKKRRNDGLYGKVVFDQNGAFGAHCERQVREGYIDTVSVGLMCFPEDVEPLEPDNPDYWFWDFYYIGPEKWNNPELLEVSLVSVPRDITARRQQDNSLDSFVEANRAKMRAALEMRAADIAQWRTALALPPGTST